MSTTHGMRIKAKQTTLLAASATAISAIGLVTGPVPAQAAPTIPLAPACGQYQFNGFFELTQSNDYKVIFAKEKGQALQGDASASHPINAYHPDIVLRGTVSGGIEGNHLDFTVRWDNGSVGHYWGDVSDDAFAHGTTVDQANTGASWDSTVALSCVTPAAPAQPPPPPAAPAQPQPAPAPASAGKFSAVTSDVDVYDAPGGNGNQIGTLRQGEAVVIVGSCSPNDWCHVTRVGTPPGVPGPDIGWVWGALAL